MNSDDERREQIPAAKVSPREWGCVIVLTAFVIWLIAAYFGAPH